MMKHVILLCVFALLSWSVASHVLVPPKGYSVGFTGDVKNGLQKYVCNSGSWSKVGSSADVFAPNGAKLAKYWSVYDPKTKNFVYYWNIYNTAGGYHESGHFESGLIAKPIRSVAVNTSSMSEYIALVTKHSGGGDAEQVAFVSLTATTGGLSPKKALCTGYGSSVGVPFGGKFTFYTQDRQPPQVPASITPPGMFVQTIFLEGKMVYRFSKGKWCYIGYYATMSDVAGGQFLGKCGTVKGGRVQYQFNSSPGVSGFTISGVRARTLRMSAEGCPWQLLRITSDNGSQTPFGKYKYALLGATYGGNPPTIASRTEGTHYGERFTGQCYLHA